jgi:RNA polymerase sigma factor (TIGR02999 family)
MTARVPGEISQLLMSWSAGNDGALKDLVPIVYPELRRLARRHLAARPPSHTLESAALVNEAYLKLVRARGLQCHSREHFFAVCAQMIRHILVDHARRHQFAKRGGRAEHVSLDQTPLGIRTPPTRGVDVLALDEALTELSEIDPRKVRVLEMRFFAGLSVEETSKVLEVSRETVQRDWRFAKAWLVTRLNRTAQASRSRIRH